MENKEEEKVFFTKAPTKRFNSNSLYELLEPPIPIKPLSPTKVVSDKEPNLRNAEEKTFVPRKRVKTKIHVKTVCNIRRDYEEYVNSYLPEDLEKQYKFLFRKIRHGSTRDEHVLEIAKKLLKLNTPISRATWQMLTNLNAENNVYLKQYVLFNGNTIKVNGSKGGSKKFLCNYDIGIAKTYKNQSRLRKMGKKNGLLNSSLVVNFKPGPLTKKVHLDESFQKFTLGKTALKPIPIVGLEINTGYGTSLEPSVLGYIQNCRDKSGILTEDWINFAVSSVGNLENSTPVQESANNITFKLKFKNDQKRILMRDNNCNFLDFENDNSYNSPNDSNIHDLDNTDCIDILKDLLTAVEISLNEDTFTVDDEDSDFPKIRSETNLKEKPQKKKCSELDKLDVTVIHVDGNPLDTSSVCSEPFCTMGCVCQSLKFIESDKFRLKSHCGRVDCMFECKCEYGKYSINDESFKDYIPGLLHLENKINSHLAKEEQKFHQTVFISEDKKIVLSAKRRNCRMTKKYADYHTQLTGKSNEQCKQVSISLPKIYCSNIETLCMVHGLYRCFCEGKFTTSVSTKIENSGKSNMENTEENSSEMIHSSITDTIDTHEILVEKDETVEEEILISGSDNDNESISSKVDVCLTNLKESVGDGITPPSQNECSNILPMRGARNSARTCSFKGKKHKTLYYTRKHEKIRQREQKNDKLSQFMLKHRFQVDSVSDESDSPLLDEYDGKISKEFINWFLKEVENLKSSMSRALLRSPAVKKKSLVPWNILMKWYKERIIFFLVNRIEPFNLYITQKPTHSAFDNCMNIEDIRVVDLPKCKSIIRHLLMNAELKEYYVILIGRSVGWEILGSVNRNTSSVPKSISSTTSNLDITSDSTPDLVENTRSPRQITKYTHLDVDESVATEPKWEVNDKSEFAENSSSAAEVKKKGLVLDEVKTVDSKPKCDVNYKSAFPGNLSSEVQLKKQVTHRDGDETVATESKRDMYEKSTFTKTSSNKIQVRKQVMHRDEIENAATESEIEVYENSTFSKNSSSKAQIRKRAMHRDEDETFAAEPKRQRKQTNTRLSDKIINNIKALDASNSSSSAEAVDDRSRWFVMTVEKDFTQIRFFRKGFYVNYASIIKAIIMARTKKKIVRLSAETHYTEKQGTTFGMYAVPSDDKYCVLIGPYDINENLNIECVTLPGSTSKEKTRGFWMYSKTLENENVLDDPLFYLSKDVESHSVTLEAATKLESMPEDAVRNENPSPSSSQQQEDHENLKKKVQAIYTNRMKRQNASQSLLKPQQVNLAQDAEQKEANKESPEKVSDKQQIKIVKPIKISRKNGFYQLATPDWLKKVSLLKSPDKDTSNFRLLQTSPPVIKMIDSRNIPQYPHSHSVVDTVENIDQLSVQVVHAEPSKHLENQAAHSSTSASSGFFILKPEEINNRLNKSSDEVDNELLLPTITQVRGGVEDFIVLGPTDSSARDPIDQDIEKFLNVHKIVIKDTVNHLSKEIQHSDTADIIIDEPGTSKSAACIPIRIECINIPNLGYIPGIMNNLKQISFIFPGFKKTAFYNQDRVFITINQVLARKVFVPKQMSLKWKLVPAVSHTTKPMLSAEYMCADYILTPSGLRHKTTFPSLHHKKRTHNTNNTVDQSVPPGNVSVVVEIDD